MSATRNCSKRCLHRVKNKDNNDSYCMCYKNEIKENANISCDSYEHNYNYNKDKEV